MFYISYLGLLIALLLFLYRNKELGDNYTLAVFYLCNSIFGIVHNAIFNSDNPTIVAVLTIHFTPIYFLVGPALYIFVKRSFINPFREKFDYLHLLFPIIIFINISPYVFSPFSEKVEFAKGIMDLTTNQYDYSTVLFPGLFQSILRPFVNVIYAIVSLVLVYQNKDKVILKKESMNSLFKYWVFAFTVIFLLANFSSFCLVSNLIFQEKFGINIFSILPLNIIKEVVMLSFYFQNLIILFVPYFLFATYFKSEYIVEKKVDQIINKAEKQKLQHLDLGILNEEKIFEITEALKTMADKNDSLANDFSLSKLALEINVPYHVLTVYFSKYLKVSFPEWKNRQRIEFVKSKLKDGAAEALTLESIGEMAGFNSRGAFIKVFKKYTGETPSEYLKKLN
jgi:AraC-like DNA-binding protein